MRLLIEIPIRVNSLAGKQNSSIYVCIRFIQHNALTFIFLVLTTENCIKREAQYIYIYIYIYVGRIIVK